MISRYEAWLNGVALSSIHEDLVILDIQYSDPEINYSFQSRAARDGADIVRKSIGKTAVTILFELRIYDVNNRMAACNQVASWAMGGGVLKTNDRLGQRLNCVCEKPPIIRSALKWTEQLSVTFAAYMPPTWEEDVPAVISLSGTTDSGTLFVPGNAGDALCEVTITPLATLTQVAISVADTAITLSGISIPANQEIKIEYDSDLHLSIKSNSVSLLNKRSGSDDLIAHSGKRNAVSITASASVNAAIRVRGRWV